MGEGCRPGLSTDGHHVFVPSLDGGPSIVIQGEEAHHLARVVKIEEHDPLSLADDTGAVAQCVVRSVERSQITVEVTRRILLPANQPRLTVVQALPKGRKMEQIVQDLTEIGVGRLIPVAHRSDDQTHERRQGRPSGQTVAWGGGRGCATVPPGPTS
ncbi:hypothetical protein BH24ACT15_BH24ACT15_06150 [soil metagenome]